MYDTRPSKENLELLKSSIEKEVQERVLTEGEQAAEKMLVASLSQPDWELRVDDPHMSINDYIKKELGEELDIKEEHWKEGATLLLRDKFWALERSPDRKPGQRPDILKVNLHYPAEGQTPSYLTKEVIEAALKAGS